MSSYRPTQQKFHLGTVCAWTDWGDPLPSLRTSPGWGHCAYVASGIDAPESTRADTHVILDTNRSFVAWHSKTG